jgi:hypothetical protein
MHQALVRPERTAYTDAMPHESVTVVRRAQHGTIRSRTDQPSSSTQLTAIQLLATRTALCVQGCLSETTQEEASATRTKSITIDLGKE